MKDFDNDWIGGMFERADRHHEQLNDEFRKLLCEPCAATPEAGSRVVVACGLIGRGHPWVRCEAIVLEAGDTSYKVRFIGRDRFDGTPDIEWVHQALITDVLKGTT